MREAASEPLVYACKRYVRVVLLCATKVAHDASLLALAIITKGQHRPVSKPALSS